MAIDLQNLPGTGKNGDHRVFSNFYEDQHIIQNVCIAQPKNLIVDFLRRRFSRDNLYTYREDRFGFPLTPDMTGLEVDSPETTRILISDGFRFDVKFYPNVIVKSNGGSAKPLAINQNATIKYKTDYYTDPLGRKIETKVPTHRCYAGFWELALEISVHCESHGELQHIIDIISMELNYASFNELRANGLLIKGINISAENNEAYANGHLYSMNVTINTISEWRVEIPISNIIEKVMFYFDSDRTPVSESARAKAQSLKTDDYIELAEVKF